MNKLNPFNFFNEPIAVDRSGAKSTKKLIGFGKGFDFDACDLDRRRLREYLDDRYVPIGVDRVIDLRFQAHGAKQRVLAFHEVERAGEVDLGGVQVDHYTYPRTPIVLPKNRR